MKKEYQTPAVEKVEFNYTETVVASNETHSDAASSEYWVSPCDNSWHSGSWGDNCHNGQYDN